MTNAVYHKYCICQVVGPRRTGHETTSSLRSSEIVSRPRIRFSRKLSSSNTTKNRSRNSSLRSKWFRDPVFDSPRITRRRDALRVTDNKKSIKWNLMDFLLLWTLGESNSSPPECKTGALPYELRARI